MNKLMIRPYKLSLVEKRMLLKAQKNYNSGNIISHEEVVKEINLWLKDCK